MQQVLPPTQYQIDEHVLAIPCFENLPLEILNEIIKVGRLFTVQDFIRNYNTLPNEIKIIYTYEPIEMIIGNITEIIAYRILTRENVSDFQIPRDNQVNYEGKEDM